MDLNQSENVENAIYKFPMAELPDRYGVSKPTAYAWLKVLSIKTVREGNFAYITAEQLQLMDELHAHLEAGRKTEEFVQQCIDSGKIISNQEALVAQEPEALIQAAAPSTRSVEGELEGEVFSAEVNANIDRVDRAAQYEAAGLLVAKQVLTAHYFKTKQFSVPGLQETVDAARASFDEQWERRNATHDPKKFAELALNRAVKGTTR